MMFFFFLQHYQRLYWEINDPIKMYLQDIFTVHANIVEYLQYLPLGVIPMSPFGIHTGRSFDEDLL